MLAFLDYYGPIDVDIFKACYTWSVLDLHVGEIYVLPVSNFFYPHATPKASVGIYSSDYLLSPKILFVYFLALPSLLHPSILLYLFLFFFIA